MIKRVLLADDHEIFLEGLCALLDKDPEFEVVGKVTDGNQAVRLAKLEKPDVVVLDLSMPGMGGIEATRLIIAEQPAPKVLCLSVHDDHGFVMGALDAGASGYVLKESAKHEVLDAIRAVTTNQVYLSPAIAGTVVNAAKSSDTYQTVTQLTEREREITRLLTQGKSTKCIADQLHLSVKTVGTHRGHIMHKLRIKSIAELTKFAIREGLTTID